MIHETEVGNVVPHVCCTPFCINLELHLPLLPAPLLFMYTMVEKLPCGKATAVANKSAYGYGLVKHLPYG